jgi:hypothetical protein
MRTVSLLHLVLLMSLVAAVPRADAGPVTGSALLPAVDNSASAPARESQESSQAGSGSALFDAVGLPLLRMSAPIYLQLGARGKLRGSGLTDSNAAAVSEIFSDSGGGGSTSSTSDIAVSVPSSIVFNNGPRAVPEPATLLLVVPALAFGVRRIARRHANTR